MATFSKADLATFRMELFATIGSGRVYNQWTVVFACCCGNTTIITFFWKRQLLSVHYHSVSFRKFITKMKTGTIVDFIFRGFINRSNRQRMFWKISVNKMQEKQLRWSNFLKKLKTEINLILIQLKFQYRLILSILIAFWNLQNTYLAKHLFFLYSFNDTFTNTT